MNSLEQLHINFANELLQQQFNEVVFVAEQRLYEAEGIDVTNVRREANQPRPPVIFATAYEFYPPYCCFLCIAMWLYYPTRTLRTHPSATAAYHLQVRYKDNSPVISLLTGKPSGLFALLEEQNILGERVATAETFKASACSRGVVSVSSVDLILCVALCFVVIDFYELH